MSRQIIASLNRTFLAPLPLLSFLMLLILSTLAFSANGWRIVTDGIEYQDINASLLTPWSHLHAFRIDLKKNKLALISAADLALQHASVNEYSEKSKALITINGGFFDNNYKPLGLRINDYQQKSALKRISWWGVFFIKNNKAQISGVNRYSSHSTINFAIQGGPRLLINNRIPPLKPGRAERTALGITRNGYVIILVTDNLPLSTTELAQFMKAPPLNCTNALNLDGGSSSQLKAHFDNFQLEVHGFSNVSDAVIVKPRPQSPSPHALKNDLLTVPTPMVMGSIDSTATASTMFDIVIDIAMANSPMTICPNVVRVPIPMRIASARC